jgi:hypothetical protein
MFYHAQLLGRSKLGFSKRKFSVSFVFRSTLYKRVLHHETARTRAACVSLSLFNNVKEQGRPFGLPPLKTGGKCLRLAKNRLNCR